MDSRSRRAGKDTIDLVTFEAEYGVRKDSSRCSLRIRTLCRILSVASKGLTDQTGNSWFFQRAAEPVQLARTAKIYGLVDFLKYLEE